MNKILHIVLLLSCLFMASCDDSNEPEEINPIRFEQIDYTIKLGTGASIPFTGGGGVYDLRASNPDVLGEYGIDMETSRLCINPAKTGQSTLTIVDVKAESTVTLNINVVDFYISFKVDGISGGNTNLFINIGDEIRFIRDAEDTKSINILKEDNSNHVQSIVANGRFDIIQSETNIFTMQMDLHSNLDEEFEAFEYTMGGDGEYLRLFDSYFVFDWQKSVASSRTQPVRRIEMTLTDNFNGCKITCVLQPY